MPSMTPAKKQPEGIPLAGLKYTGRAILWTSFAATVTPEVMDLACNPMSEFAPIVVTEVPWEVVA
jgi:hypothetical protein